MLSSEATSPALIVRRIERRSNLRPLSLESRVLHVETRLEGFEKELLMKRIDYSSLIDHLDDLARQCCNLRLAGVPS